MRLVALVFVTLPASLTVDKKSVAAMSLVAAIPAAIMLAIAVLAFLNHADNMPTLLQVITGLVLLVCVFLALAPLGILLQIPFLRLGYASGPQPVKAPKPSRKEKQAAKKAKKGKDQVEAAEHEEPEGISDALADDDFDASDSSAEIAAGDSDEFEFEDGLSDADFDLSFDDEDDKL